MTVFGTKLRRYRRVLAWNLIFLKGLMKSAIERIRSNQWFSLRKKKLLDKEAFLVPLDFTRNHFVRFTERALRQSTFNLHICPITGPTAFKKNIVKASLKALNTRSASRNNRAPSRVGRVKNFLQSVINARLNPRIRTSTPGKENEEAKGDEEKLLRCT